MPVAFIMTPPLRARLVLHPMEHAPADVRVDVDVAAADDGSACVDFTISAPDSVIVMPEARPPAAADGLWRHTCGELFVAAKDSEGYREFNFSPSGQWAVFDFSAYRVRLENSAAAVAPDIELRRSPAGYRLIARLSPGSLPSAPKLHLAATMVLEMAGGTLTHWALRHPVERPDFHHRDGFVCAAPAAANYVSSLT